MANLYNGNYIKTDKISEALRSARSRGKLSGVSDSEIRDFVQEFEKVIKSRGSSFSGPLNRNKVADILKIMGYNTSDSIDNQELGTISGVLLNQDFIF